MARLIATPTTDLIVPGQPEGIGPEGSSETLDSRLLRLESLLEDIATTVVALLERDNGRLVGVSSEQPPPTASTPDTPDQDLPEECQCTGDYVRMGTKLAAREGVEVASSILRSLLIRRVDLVVEAYHAECGARITRRDSISLQDTSPSHSNPSSP